MYGLKDMNFQMPTMSNVKFENNKKSEGEKLKEAASDIGSVSNEKIKVNSLIVDKEDSIYKEFEKILTGVKKLNKIANERGFFDKLLKLGSRGMNRLRKTTDSFLKKGTVTGEELDNILDEITTAASQSNSKLNDSQYADTDGKPNIIGNVKKAKNWLEKVSNEIKARFSDLHTKLNTAMVDLIQETGQTKCKKKIYDAQNQGFDVKYFLTGHTNPNGALLDKSVPQDLRFVLSYLDKLAEDATSKRDFAAHMPSEGALHGYVIAQKVGDSDWVEGAKLKKQCMKTIKDGVGEEEVKKWVEILNDCAKADTAYKCCKKVYEELEIDDDDIDLESETKTKR